MSFTIFNGFNFGKVQTQNAAGGGAVGGWKELGRTTLGSNQSSIDVASLSNKRYYMVLTSLLGKSANINQTVRLNNDSGTNYAYRISGNGGADGTAGNQDFYYMSNHNNTLPEFSVQYLANYSTKEKLILGHEVNQSTAGAGTAPVRMEAVNKWANTANAISSIKLVGDGSSTYTSGSEVVVLGYDPADTHTTNFWEELASASWISGTSLPTVSFTAKKYLWVQFFTSGGIGGDGANRVSVRVGNGSIDTGANYAFRNSESGGADGATTGDTRWLTHTGNKKNFTNMFIINTASNEKLSIYHTSEGSGTGAGSFPSRIEGVGKWANTANQINQISVFDFTGGNSFNAGEIKVWGSN